MAQFGLTREAAIAVLHELADARHIALVRGTERVLMAFPFSAIATPFVYTARRFSNWNRHIGWVTGLVSVALGLFLVYQIGFVNGLFGATPRWEPH